MTDPGRAGAEVLAVGWRRQGLGLAANCRCGLRSVAGAGRCRWAWLHRQRHHNPAAVTTAPREQSLGSQMAAKSLQCSGSSEPMKIRKWSERVSCCPAAVTAAAALLVVLASVRGRPCPAHSIELMAGAVLAMAALPLRGWGAIAVQRWQASLVAEPSAFGMWGRRPPVWGAAAPRAGGDPTRSRDPKTWHVEDRRGLLLLVLEAKPCSAPVQCHRKSARDFTRLSISAGV